MACVNTRSKEFKDTAARLNINSAELELIVHKFINLTEENLDKFPSDLYILDQLSPTTFEASLQLLDLYFKASHMYPMIFMDNLEFKLGLEKLQLVYPESAIKGYKAANGNYIITVATPKVEGIPMTLDNSMIDSFLRGVKENNPYHSLFTKLVLAIGKDNIEIRMAQKSPIGRNGKTSYADYNLKTGVITFYVDSILKHKKLNNYDDALTRRYLFQTLTHELLHQLTVKSFLNPVSVAAESFVKEIKLLYKEAVDYFGSKDAHYGLFDELEFISEAMTNILFLRELAKIKSKVLKSRSLWSRLVDAIGNIFKEKFGLDIRNTVLEDTITSIDSFIDYTKEFKEQDDLYRESLEELDDEILQKSYSELHEALKSFRGDLNKPSYKGFTTGRFENTRGKWRIVIPESFRGTVAEARDIAKEMLGSRGATEEMYSLGKDFDRITDNGVTYTTLRVGFKSDKRGQTTNKTTELVKEKIKVPKKKLTPEEKARQDAIDLLLEVRPDLKDRIENELIDVDYLINNPDEITTLASAFLSPNEIKDEYTIDELLELDNIRDEDIRNEMYDWGYSNAFYEDEIKIQKDTIESAFNLTFLSYSNLEAAEALSRVKEFFKIDAIEDYNILEDYHDTVEFLELNIETFSQDNDRNELEEQIYKDLKLVLQHKDALLKSYLDNFIRFNPGKTKLEEVLRNSQNTIIENVYYDGIDISDWLNNRRSIIQQHDNDKKGSLLTIFDDYKIAPVKIKGLSTLEKQLSVLSEPTTIQNNEVNAYLTRYTLHSGGAEGSDITWGKIGEEFGLENANHYYTGQKSGMNSPHGNKEISELDYEEGRSEAAKAAQRNWGYSYPYMKDSRLIRNWAQVKYADAIFAVGTIVHPGERIFPNQKNDTRTAIVPSVAGGTGYAVGMAILHDKPVYVFDLNTEQWYTWDSEVEDFIETDTPILTENFAGIGTREINDVGREAIRDVYAKTTQALYDEAMSAPFIELLEEVNKDNILANQVIEHLRSIGIEVHSGEEMELYLKESNNIQEFTTENGEVYGFVTPEGLMYLDERVINEEHPIHEYTHLWDRAVLRRKPILWQRGIELMSKTPLWDAIANSDQYGKKWAQLRMSRQERVNLIASEVHARLVGKDGVKILNELAEQEGKSGIINKLRKWLKDFWKELKSTFGSWKNADLDNLTLEEFNMMTLRDFAEGTDIGDVSSTSRLTLSTNTTALQTGVSAENLTFLKRSLLITELVNNLRNTEDLTQGEIREIANEVVYWISDFITNLLSNLEQILNDLQESGFLIDHLKNEDFASMSRADVVKKLGVENILKRAKLQFDPNRNEDNEYYDDIDVILQMEAIMDNFEGLMEFAQPTFLAVEKFSIRYNDLGLAEVNDDISEAIDATDFNNTNSEEEVKEIEGNEAEHWMIESRTRDIMEDMGKAVENALVQCYLLDENGDRVKSKRGIDMRVDRRQATNSIVRWTLGALTLADMVAKLQEKQESHPWVLQLISKLLDLSGKYNDLLSQFFSDFYKPFQLYSVVKYEKGKYRSMPVNEHKALTEATNQIIAQYNTGKHPLFTSEGINTKNLTDLSTQLEELKQSLSNKELDWTKQDTKDKLANDIAYIANLLGYYTIPEMVTDAITRDNVIDMKNALNWIVKSLTDNKDNKSYEPFVFKSKGSIRKNVQDFLRPITNLLEDIAISSFFDSGKMYLSYITPSYMSKLMQKFRLTGDLFLQFIENEFKKYDWFYDKNKGEWLNDWVRQLATNSTAREIFAHKTLLNFNKKNYMKDMNDMEYAMSLISEYFAESENETQSLVPAWFRIPMMSNKPSSEFIKFYSYRGITYKENITNGLKNIFNQELRRIQTVTMRNRSKTDSDFIKNWDTNGKQFNFLTFMNEYLKENPSKEKEFSSLLKRKIKGEKLAQAEENKLYSEAKRIIREHMENKVKNTVDAWALQGILKAAEKITGIGKNPTEIRENLENFVWNDYYAAMNIMQLTITDIAYYKNAEDLLKRLAQIHSPGIRGNADAKLYKSFTDKFGGDKVTDGFTRTFYLKDFEDVVSNIIENVEIVFDKKIQEAKDRGNTTEARGLEVLKDSLVGEEGQFRKINVTDALGYCSPTAYMKKALIFGKWSERRQQIYNRLKEGDFKYDTLKEAFQPLKPFVYSLIEKSVNAKGAPMLNIKMGVLNKNSEYLLVLADAILQGQNTGRPNLLRAIYEVMEESHFDANGKYRTDGIDTVLFESTVKVGLTGVVDINKYISLKPFLNNIDGERQAKEVMKACIYNDEYKPTRLEVNPKTNELEETVSNARVSSREYNNTFVHTIPIEDYSIQQDTPEHFKKHSQAHGSQGRYIIPSELAETDAFGNEILYSVKNVVTDENGRTLVRDEKVNAKEFKRRYEKNIADNIEESIEEIRKELHLDSGSVKERNIAISKVLQREILSSPRYGVDLLLACSVDENGRFRIPLGDPIQSKRIELLLTSIVKNRVNKLKIAGGPVVLVSNFGTSRELNIRFKDKNGGLLMTRAEWEKSRESIPLEVYHYSNEDNLTEFTQKEDNYFSQEKGGTKNAIFFTDNTAPKEGTVLARNNKYTVKLDAKKVKVVRGTKEDMHKRGTSYTEEVNKAEQEGYDAVRFLNLDDNQEYNLNITVIFDPSKATIVKRELTVPSKESNESTYKEYVKNNQGGIAYFEVFAPIYSDDLLKFTDGQGNIDIDMIELVNPDLLKMVGYRIPTEAKYSMAPLKIVGFLPRAAGEGIMLPNDITLLTGSDFDIDKEYLMRKEFDIAFKYEPKSLSKMSEEELANMSEAEQDWIKNNKRNIISEIRKELEKTNPLTRREYKLLEKLVNEELQMKLRAEDRTHQSNLDAINKKYDQLIEAGKNAEYSTNEEKNKKIIDNKEKGVNRERRNEIANENKRFKNITRRIESKFSKENDEKLNRLIKQFERNKLNKAINDFFEVDKGLPTKYDNSLTRAIRKAYLNLVVMVIEPTSGRSFRNNLIVDMTYEILTHEQSCAEMLNPGGFEPLKRMGYLVAAYRDPNNTKTWQLLENMTTDQLKDLCLVDKNLMDIDTHIQFYKQNSAAGSLIGIFAVERVAHAVIENEGYQMDIFKACKMDKREPFKALGVTFGENKGLMEIDVRLNSLGESIGKVLGSLVASAADAVKDPVLNLMNINSQTANVLNTLIRMGISFDDAALFLSTAAISNVLNTVSRENLLGFKTFGQVINERLREIEEKQGIKKDSPIHKEDLTKKELINSIKLEDMTLDAEYKILQAFKKFRAMAEAMRLPTFATRFNSISNAVGPLAIDNLMVEYKTKKLSLESSILDKNGKEITMGHIMNNHPILHLFQNTFPIAYQLLKNMPSNSNSFRGFLESFEDNTLYDKIMKDRKLLSSLSDFYLSYLLIENGVIDANELKYYITEFPNEFLLNDYKSKYQDNLLIQSIRYGSDKASRLTLEVSLTGVDTADKEKIGDAWSDLYKLDHELALKLFKYCFFRGGVGFNPKSFMALLPMLMKENIPGYIDTYRNLPPVISEFVLDLFVRNNWDSNKLVPSLDSEKTNIKDLEDGTVEVKVRTEAELYLLAETPYFKIRMNIEGKDVDKMFKLIEVMETDPKQPPTTYFKEIEPLGSNKDYIEISTNDLEKATDTTIKVEEEELPPGIQDTEIMAEPPLMPDIPFPDDFLFINPIYELNSNLEHYRDIAIDAYFNSGEVASFLEAIDRVDEYKTLSDQEKSRRERGMKKFFRDYLQSKNLDFSEEEVNKVYESIC